jgi:transposase
MNTHDANPDSAAAAGVLFNLNELGAVERDANQNVPTGAAPRLRLAERHQGEFRMVVLDKLLPPDHQVRMVWEYVCQVDLSPILAKVQAVEGKPGRDTTDPRILLCLWLYATLEGIGAARELDRLCTEHLAFLWICGGVSVNYHLLADFRTDHTEVLDQLLTHSVAALRNEGLVDLERVAQDGMRVRASAGAASFRRRDKLQGYLQEAKKQVERLKEELEHDPTLPNKKRQAARQRAAREKAERLEHALQELEKIEASREARKKGSGDQARASSTDPEARKMKMPDGGFRPAYNAQLATDTDSRIIVGVDMTNAVSDGGQMGPMLDEIKERHDQVPKDYLVDGGFTSRDDINYAATEHKVTVYAPIKEQEKKQQAGKDPFAPQKGDTPPVQDWRQRMGTEGAQRLYRLRAATAEWTNAQARNRGLYRVTVRGLAKVKAVLLLYALVHNLVQGQALRVAQQAGTEG